MRVLIIEDEEHLAAALGRRLQREGVATEVAHDGETGLRLARERDYDVVVLDRDLPRLHGDEVCRRLHADRARARILMLTAAGDVRDRVTGLTLGADDYLGKPFALEELVARLHALARREGIPAATVLERGDLRLDVERRTVTRAGRPVTLRNREFDLLRELMAADGRVLSAAQLLDRLWDGPAEPFENTVRVTLMRLRRKLGQPPPIETVVGAGYRIR